MLTHREWWNNKSVASAKKYQTIFDAIPDNKTFEQKAIMNIALVKPCCQAVIIAFCSKVLLSGMASGSRLQQSSSRVDGTGEGIRINETG
jgi:hypothetical protein